ncbi:MAG TPA: glycoside hydrolase family 43 protein [Candidatus Methylacidiphilales bacterium]
METFPLLMTVRPPLAMLRSVLVWVSCLALLGGTRSIAQDGPAPAAMPQTCYLFAYFTEPNGKDGLRLAWSRDGYAWTPLNGGRGYLKPSVGVDKLMRDPCILRGPDGIYRMVWTVSWGHHGDFSVGYASSPDLIHWSDQEAIPVMASEPAAANCWAPEINYDAENGEYLLYWSSTIPGRFIETDGTAEGTWNHRFYCTTTKDFKTWTPTRVLYDPGFCCIDATIMPSPAADGRFLMFFKNETLKPKAAKNLWMATAEHVGGPYGHLVGPLTGPASPLRSDWAEGPTSIRIGDDYIVYFDCYRQHRYGAIRSKDLKTWEDISDKVSFPAGARHGTVLEVPGEVVAKLLAASTTAP